MSFSDIIGQPAALKQIKSALSSGRLPPAFLFCGPSGVGKAFAARELAKALNCRDDGARGAFDCCGRCESCLQAARGLHPDIINADFAFQAALLDREAEKEQHIRIDTIRELCSRAQQKGYAGNWKVIIVDRAETMLQEAANALLKFLEEPPPRTLWALISARKSSMLSTILSRCQTVEFGALPPEGLEEVLLQQSFSLDEARPLALVAEGSVERALKIRALAEKLSELDGLDPLYASQVAKLLPRELAKARADAALMLELLIKSAHLRWKEERVPQRRGELKSALGALFEYRGFLNKNVSPDLIIETALLELRGLNLPFLPKSA